MEKVDKTKDNIGVSGIDDQTRKKLYEKFVQGGGKAIESRDSKTKKSIVRDSGRQYQQRYKKPEKKDDTKVKKTVKPSGARVVQQKRVTETKTSPFISFINKLILRIKIKISGIAPLGSIYFSTRFFEKFNSTHKLSLMELQILYLEIFKKNLEIGRKITDRLDEIKPIYYELIEMTGNIYDKILIDQIIDHYVNFPDIPTKISDLKEPLMKLYRSLYILSQYEIMINNAFTSAIDTLSKLEKDKKSPYPAMKRKLKNGLFNIFHKLYPKLHLLYCYYESKIIDLNSSELPRLLAITESEKPGNRQVKKADERESTEESITEEATIDQKIQDDEELFISKSIKTGLDIMARVDIKRLRKEYDKSKLFVNVTDSNKVLLTWVLFNEFDKEYSFILTTNKIKYNITFTDKEKSDFKARLNNLYDQMRNCSDHLNEYAGELAIYEKARQEKPSSGSQYIEYTKRLETIEKKMVGTGKTALASVKSLIINIKDELRFLIDDMNSSQNFIDNPQDVLEFDQLIEGDKKIHGKKIYEAITIVYCYALAFVARLESGDLSGHIFSRNEDRLSEKEVETPSEQKADSEAKDKSILDELDDML